MITKRSRFWTFLFAFLPGAGHMYNGFMKLGVSFMSLFFGIWMVASVINIGPIAFLAAVVWFYAFFDCINKIFQDDEEFYAQEDRYLFTRDQLERWNSDIFGERSRAVGVVLVVLGVYALWNNVILHFISENGFLPPAVYDMILNVGNLVPQFLVAGLIIWAGISLISGKKKEMEDQPTGRPESSPAGRPESSPAGRPEDINKRKIADTEPSPYREQEDKSKED